MKAILFGAIIAGVSFPILLPFKLTVLSGIFFVVPIAIAIYSRYSLVSDLEDNFRQFLNDLRDTLQAGIGVTTGLEVLARGNYGKLTPYIRKLSTQVRLGIPFEKAMTQVFSEIHSPIVNKMILVIVETHKAGGDIIKIFGTSTEYVTKIERLKIERQTRTMGTLVSSYIMFFVFVVIIIGIQAFFLPMLEAQTGTGQVGMQGSSAKKVDFSSYFLWLVVIQSLFAGPMIGKISENSLLAGVKHSVILLTVSAAAYAIALQFIVPSAVPTLPI